MVGNCCICDCMNRGIRHTVHNYYSKYKTFLHILSCLCVVSPDKTKKKLLTVKKAAKKSAEQIMLVTKVGVPVCCVLYVRVVEWLCCLATVCVLLNRCSVSSFIQEIVLKIRTICP